MYKNYFQHISTSSEPLLSLINKVFAYQSKYVKIYREYISYVCPSLLMTGAKIQSIYSIPFLPIEVFKTHKVITRKFVHYETVFKSSGTMGERSKHYIADISLYERSFTEAFRFFYGLEKNWHILALLPSYLEQGDSSLVYMVKSLIKNSQSSYSGFYLENSSKLYDTLLELEHSNKKILLIGVSYALLDFACKYTFPSKLNNLTVMETGGMKGRGREILRSELHLKLKKSFKCDNIHSEYGMTELLSQAYSKGDGIFFSPKWMKVLIGDLNDPCSFVDLNKTGQIKIIDLANIYSCCFIATQDIGTSTSNGAFTVIGRNNNADLRGCNMLLNS